MKNETFKICLQCGIPLTRNKRKFCKDSCQRVYVLGNHITTLTYKLQKLDDQVGVTIMSLSTMLDHLDKVLKKKQELAIFNETS